MRYPLLHEHESPVDKLAREYDVETYQEMKDRLRSGLKAPSYTPFQRLIALYVSATSLAGKPPRALIVNKEMALELLQVHGEVPLQIEEVQIVFHPEGISKVAWLG